MAKSRLMKKITFCPDSPFYILCTVSVACTGPVKEGLTKEKEVGHPGG